MKTTNIFKTIVTALAVVFTFNACVEDADYSIPDVTTVQDPGLVATNTIQSVKDMYSGSVVDFSAFGDLIIEGYVVSSDETGNFFKTLSIQDKPVDPTAAIQLSVDANDMYAFYELGRKVYVKLNGLGMHNDSGVLEIGALDGTSVVRIPSTSYKSHILRSTEVAMVQPRLISSISDISDAYISMLVQFDDMQTANKGETYANVDNTFSVNRIFKSCADDETIIVRNSGFADFRAQSMPEGKGMLTAVLGKFNSSYQLFIRSTDDLVFDGNRCDPLFEDDFSTNNYDKWTIQDVLGDEGWDIAPFGNPAPSARVSGFNSGAQNNEDWLISKAVDLSAVSGTVVLSFDNVKRFSGADIEVYFSTDYQGGDPNTDGSWTQLSPTIDTNTGSWSSWTNSGDLDVSAAVGGNLFIAFKYTSNTSAAATFEIDNVKVSAQ